ncbi:hypothetical protein NX059_008195 [Plenodomus lindquistii]|nr:hypothetical protein NX059_008195 [Plenodomus lindquistii]
MLEVTSVGVAVLIPAATLEAAAVLPAATELDATAVVPAVTVLEATADVPAADVPAATVLDLPGLGDAKEAGKLFGASPFPQSAWPPNLTTIPNPALGSGNPLSSWNFFTSNGSPSPGNCNSVISLRPGFVYMRNEYCLLSPVSPKEPGAL